MPRIALFVTVVLAASLRFANLDLGRGVLASHPDERSTIDAVEASRVWQVSYFHLAYGGGYIYPLYGFVRAVEQVVGLETLGKGSPRTDAGGRPYGEYIVARSWSALLSTIAVCLTAVLGWRIGGPWTGFLAAMIIAVSPVAVRDAHLSKADSASTLAATMVLVVLTTRTQRAFWLVALGLTTGFALSVKYQVGVLPAVVLALYASGLGPRSGLRRVLGAGLIAAVVALTLNAFWLWAPQLSRMFFEALVRSQHSYVRFPWFDGFAPDPIAYHARISLVCGLGWPVALLALPALAIALWQSGPVRLIAITVLGQWLVLIQNPLTLSRNFLPSAPGLAILVAHIVTRAVGAAVPRRALPLAVAMTTATFVFQPLVDAFRMVQLFGEEDTRVLAYRWLDENVPVGATLAIYGTQPSAPPYGFPVLGSGRWKTIVAPGPESLARQVPPVYLVSHSYPLPYSSGRHPPAAAFDRSLAVFEPFSGPVVDAVFEPFDAFYLPLACFSGIARPGPRIEIWRADGSSTGGSEPGSG